MAGFPQRFFSAIKNEGFPVILKTGIITIVGGYLFDITPLNMIIMALIFCFYTFTQKALRFFSNRYLLEMFYYLGIIWAIVLTSWLGYMKFEDTTVYFIGALLGYLFYKTFDTYRSYSVYKSIENDLLNNLLEQLETTKVISIHAARKKSLFNNDEIKETISSFQHVNKLPHSLKIID